MANAECAEMPRRWAERAKEMIDIEYLLQFFKNQETGWSRHVQVRNWDALAVKMDVVHPSAKNPDMLVRMKQYIATMPSEMCCPCTRGIVLNTIGHHFLKCDAVPALEPNEKQLAQVDAATLKLDRKLQRNEHKWADNNAPSEKYLQKIPKIALSQRIFQKIDRILR